jgi:hypothetical protein
LLFAWRVNAALSFTYSKVTDIGPNSQKYQVSLCSFLLHFLQSAGVPGGGIRSQLSKGFLTLGLALSERLIRREGKWSGLHLPEASEDGKLEWFSDMTVSFAHIKSTTS